MNHRVIVLGLALAFGAACSSNHSGDDGGAGDAAAPTMFFMGTYRATTDVSAELGTVSNLALLVSRAESYQFTMVQGMLASGAPVPQLLGRVDREFLGDAGASGEFSLAATVQRGVAAGTAATDDDARDVAFETVAKPLDVALGLGMHSELRAAVADVQAGNLASATSHWDRAAAYFTGLEPSVAEYSNQTVPGVWGTRDALASTNIATLVVDLLRRGRAALDAGAARSAIEIGSQAQLSITRLYFLSGAKYSRVIENAVHAMTPLDAAAATEGTYAFEGVILPFNGAQPSAAATTARAHWRGDASAITEARYLRDAAALYVEANAGALEGYVAATDNARWATIARFNGVLDALDEALTYAGEDVSALRNQLVAARDLSGSGRHAEALAGLMQVQSAIGRVGTTR